MTIEYKKESRVPKNSKARNYGNCLTCNICFFKEKETRKFCSNKCRGIAARKSEFELKYSGIHMHLKKYFAKNGVCDHCKTKNAKRTEWAKKHGCNYTRNREDYFELCTSCHKRYDLTEEIRKKMSLAHIGKESPWRWKSVRSIDKKGKEKIYKNITDASNEIKIIRTSIVNALKGRAKTAANLRWEYV